MEGVERMNKNMRRGSVSWKDEGMAENIEGRSRRRRGGSVSHYCRRGNLRLSATRL